MTGSPSASTAALCRLVGPFVAGLGLVLAHGSGRVSTTLVAVGASALAALLALALSGGSWSVDGSGDTGGLLARLAAGLMLFGYVLTSGVATERPDVLWGLGWLWLFGLCFARDALSGRSALRICAIAVTLLLAVPAALGLAAAGGPALLAAEFAVRREEALAALPAVALVGGAVLLLGNVLDLLAHAPSVRGDRHALGAGLGLLGATVLLLAQFTRAAPTLGERIWYFVGSLIAAVLVVLGGIALRRRGTRACAGPVLFAVALGLTVVGGRVVIGAAEGAGIATLLVYALFALGAVVFGPLGGFLAAGPLLEALLGGRSRTSRPAPVLAAVPVPDRRRRTLLRFTR